MQMEKKGMKAFILFVHVSVNKNIHVSATDFYINTTKSLPEKVTQMVSGLRKSTSCPPGFRVRILKVDKKYEDMIRCCC